VGKGMGVRPLWTMDAYSRVRGCVRTAQKVLEGNDRQTDRQTDDPTITSPAL